MKKQISKQMVSYMLIFALLLSGSNSTVLAAEVADEAVQEASEVSVETTDSEETEEISGTEVSTGDESIQEEVPETTEQEEVIEEEIQTSDEFVYETEGYTVLFQVDGAWDQAFNATVTISNTGERTIENWYLTFELPNTISSIWNAAIVTNEQGRYTIKNASWNQDIPAGGSVSFGFIAQGTLQDAPVYYGLPGRSIELNEDIYSIQYTITRDWIEGFIGNVVIKNNSDKVLEDWYLEFDFENEISQIWNAVIDDHYDDHYSINNDHHNSDIEAGESVEFSFQVDNGSADNLIENVRVGQRGIEEEHTLEGVLLLAGRYHEESNALEMKWSGTWQTGEYSLYVAEKVINIT